MNKKALSLAVCLAVTYSSATYALGLGEIESSSHLNQPFRAKINLLSTSAADVKRLKVRIASPEVFSRVGIERPKYLDSISFTPSVENGKPIIIVNSNQPINQPFLNFLLEVSWPNGQLLKEYTVLLDPPVLVQPGTAVANNTVGVRAEPKRQQQVTSAKAPQHTTRPTKTVSKKTISSSRAAVPRKKTTKGSRKTTHKYRVVRGDSLYKVAKKLGRKGVRTEQMMMAIYRANPTAFRKRNINNLKAGALLRRPSKRDALSLSYAKSKSSIYKQSTAWRKYRSKLAKKTVSQSQVRKPSRSQGTSQTPVVKNTQARIEVIGSSSSAVDTKNLSATGSAKIDQLERQLVQANESLAAKANANTELKSRVSELESLLRKKNRLITLKNEQLAELQAKLGVPVSATTTDAQEGSDIRQQVKNAVNQDGTIVRSGASVETEVATPTDPLANEQLAVVDGSTEIPSVFEKDPAKSTEMTDSSTVDDTVISPEVADESNAGDNQGSVLDLLSSPLVMGLGGGSLLALLFGWLLMRRRGKSADYEEYSSIDFDDPEFAPGSVSEKNMGEKSDKVNPDDAFAGLEGDFDDLDFGDAVDTDRSTKENGAHSDSVNDDILQEADVYIVYGLHDQAEVELKKALEKQPNNLQYHAKLLENFKASSDVAAFDEQAEIFSKLPDDAGANKDELWKTITEWANELKSKSSLFESSSSVSANVAAGAAAATAVAGGIAVTAGKAFAEDKLDDDIKGDSAGTSKVDDLDLSGLDDLGNDVDFDTSEVKPSEKESFNDDDFELDELLANDEDDTFNITESTPEQLDASSFDDLFDDVDMDAPSLSKEKPDSAEASTTELGSEFEDLLDLDLTDLDGDFSLDSNSKAEDSSGLGLSNLELELDNDNDLNKILPSSSAYLSKKDDATVTDNLLGDLDDDLSFMDLDDDDHELRETQVSTKLDLARAYLDMGDIEGARNTLEEVMMEGNDDQKKEAEELLHQAG